MKIQRTSVIIINYNNTNFSLELTSKVEKVGQSCLFTHKLTTNRSFYFFLFFSLTVTDWKAQDCRYHRQRRIHPSCFQKSLIWKCLSKQDVTRSLDSDMPWCPCTSLSCLCRQHFSAFGCNLCVLFSEISYLTVIITDVKQSALSKNIIQTPSMPTQHFMTLQHEKKHIS